MRYKVHLHLLSWYSLLWCWNCGWIWLSWLWVILPQQYEQPEMRMMRMKIMSVLLHIPQDPQGADHLQRRE